MRARRLAFVLAIAIGGLVVAWWFAAPRGDAPRLAEQTRDEAISVPPTLAAATPSVPAGHPAAPAATEPAAPVESPDPAPVGVIPPRDVRVYVNVVMPNGRTPAAARVKVDGDEENLRAWLPGTPYVDLPPGGHRICVLAGRFGEWRSTEIAVDVPKGAPASVDVRLDPVRMIVGRVIASPGESVARSGVYLDPVEEPGTTSTERMGDASTVQLGPPEDGWFQFGGDGLEAGVYDVSAAPWKSGPRRATQRVMLADAPVFVELRLPPIDLSEGVVLHVVDPAGARIAADRVEVQVVVWDEAGSVGSGGATVHARPDGSLWVPTVLPPYSEREPVEVLLRVRVKGLGLRRVPVPSVRGSEPLTVQFETPANGRLRIDGRTEWLQGELALRLGERDGHSFWGVASAVVTPQGIAELAGIQPGTYAAVVEGKPLPWRTSIDLGSVTLRRGEQEIVVRAPTLHAARVAGAQDGILVLHRAETYMTRAEWHGPGRPEPTQQAPGLPAGDYVARAGGRSAALRLPAVGPVTLVEQPR